MVDDNGDDAHIDLLSYPSTLEELPEETSADADHQERRILKDRLYIGNLHPTVDEYSLLQIFSKFGKVTKLDFLFHKSGPLKGKPRGYAFIEYASNDEALKALNIANDKLVRGRKLVVTFAQQAPHEHGGTMSGIKRRAMMEVGRPTTLSLLKTGVGHRNEITGDKIALLEAKLRQMEKDSKLKAEAIPGSSFSPSLHHPSLPPKPSTPLPDPPSKQPRPNAKSNVSELPQHPPTVKLQLKGRTEIDTSASGRTTKLRLSGVKIGKSKEKGARLEKSLE
ncbi:hypothetical protein H0H93_008297 [Arthromyces matolae]|nr:hypothetical protein H0H93_008297 [Arthromyces matolae]